jgi:hypothetical protein
LLQLGNNVLGCTFLWSYVETDLWEKQENTRHMALYCFGRELSAHYTIRGEIVFEKIRQLANVEAHFGADI